VIALTIALGLILAKPQALLAASPVLLLWALAPAVVSWLNSPPRAEEGPLHENEKEFLERHALLIWRYFLEFGGPENHWLIPDNVEEKDTFQVRKLSPTNLGMLFNSRQAAHEFGFITTEYFAEASLGTLNTYERLEKQRGHIYNWYDIERLEAIMPKIVSAVDSGNLAASLYSLHTGALDVLKAPLLSEEVLRQQALEPRSKESGWVAEERGRIRESFKAFRSKYAPWLDPKFSVLLHHDGLAGLHKVPTLQGAAKFASEMDRRLAEFKGVGVDGSDLTALVAELRGLLRVTAERLAKLASDVTEISRRADEYANAMQYGFLLVKARKLLSIGYDGITGELYGACYDLLASEARMAFFLAVAKGDISQECWFRLDRSHVLVKGRACLVSWTGTMFEYMMPALWMQPFANTLITRALESAARIQRDYVRNMPWGISESGFARMDTSGRYGYQAFGIPQLALKYGAEDGPVISPYSTFLAMQMIRDSSIENLHKMESMGWTGEYGFYEAADYTEGREPRMVRSWMAHHQGMSLLALANLLRDDCFRKWFHANAIVRATELLLHEKPLSKESKEALEEAVVAKPGELAAGASAA